MSTRKPRNSLGLPNNGGPLRPESSLEAFEDFRRRHSRQNKEIIIENAIRRTTIKSLQDEIAALHVELVEVRQANSILSAQVQRLHTQATRVHGDATREAIDHILSAIPALRQLRNHLDSTLSSPTAGESEKNIWSLQSTDNPTATRPAAVAAEIRGLGTLQETSEYGSDASQSEIVEKRIKDKSVNSRRRTDIGSVAASRSPRPNNPTSTYIEITSPSSSHSPSPEKIRQARSPAGEKKHKRRRESGLLAPPPRSPSPPAEPEQTQMAEIPDWDEGRNIIVLPKSARSATQSKASETKEAGADSRKKDRVVGSIKIRDIAADLADTDAFGPLKSSSGHTVDKQDRAAVAEGGASRVTNALPPTIHTVPLLVPLLVPSTGSSTSAKQSDYYTPETVASASSELEILISPPTDDDGGRGRRSRKSVNYKEPSLTKKMRKPDGVTVEDTLGLPRTSLSMAGSPADFELGATSGAITKRGNATTHLTSMRRKSVLPKAGSRIRTPADEDDEDELEDSPDLDLATPQEEEIKVSSSPDTAPWSSSSSATITEITPTPFPRSTSKESIPTSRPSAPAPTAASASARSSPGKPQLMSKKTVLAVGSGSGGTASLGVGRPTSSSAQHSRSASGRVGAGREKEKERGALLDRRPDNGPLFHIGSGGTGTTLSKAKLASVGSGLDRSGVATAVDGRKVSRRMSSAV